jgi:hypothetical protein
LGGGRCKENLGWLFPYKSSAKKKITRLHVLYASVKDKLTLCSEGDFSPSYLQ